MTPRHPQWKPFYASWEDKIIRDNMLDIDKNIHWDVMRRCQRISDEHLPHRSADGIKARWYILIGKVTYKKDTWEGPLGSLDDLKYELSEATQKWIKIRIQQRRMS